MFRERRKDYKTLPTFNPECGEVAISLPALCERGRRISFPITYESPPCEVFNDAALQRHEASCRGIRSACPSANTTYARMHTKRMRDYSSRYNTHVAERVPLVSRISVGIPFRDLLFGFSIKMIVYRIMEIKSRRTQKT